MNSIVLELASEFDESEKDSVRHLQDEIQVITSRRFDGELAMQVLATLNAVTIPVLAKIIVERIRSNRHVSVKYKGLTVTGMSAESTLKILRQLANND